MVVARFLAILLGLCIGAAAAEAPTALTFGTLVFPPFSNDDNGRAQGPFVEVMQAVCARLQLNCTIVVLPWRRALSMVDDGALSGAFPLARVPEREKAFYFGVPVVDTEYAVYAVTGNPFRYRTVDDLAGHTVGMYGPSGTSMSFSHLTDGVANIKTVLEIDNLTVLKKLGGGRYGPEGLAFVNGDVARSLMAEQALDNVREVGVAQHLSYYVGLSRKSVPAELAMRFDKVLADMNKGGDVALIFRKYGVY